MKATRLAGCTLPFVLAAVFGLLSASPALAASKLQLEAGGVPVAAGSASSVGFVVEECGIFSNGAVVTNGEAKDVLSGTSSSEAECPHAGEAISGLITETQIKSSGAVKMKGTIDVALAGNCTYAFKNPKGATTFPGFATVHGTAKGKLVKGSSTSCAKTTLQKFFADATSEPFGEPFEGALS
jgi:hypothetical protein